MDGVSTAMSLFRFVVEALNSIQLARSFQNDFAQHQIKLDIMQLRLLRWGEIVNIDTIDETQPTASAEAKGILSSMQNRLQKAKSESSRLGKKIQKPQKGDAEAVNHLDPESCLTEEFKRLRNWGRAARQKHKAQAYIVVESVKWMIYKRDSFDQLLESISSSMDRLESIPDIDNGKLRKFCEEDCKGLNQPDLERLDLAIDGCDPFLEKAIFDKLQHEDHGRSITMSYNTGHITGIHNGDNKGHNYGDNSSIY